MTARDSTRHQLYRHFNSEGQLLYVGISLSAVARLSQHKNSDGSCWYDDVASMTIENHSDRYELEQAEKQAIKDEKPLHNVMHNNAKNKRKPTLPKTDEGKQILQFLYSFPEGEKASEFDIRTYVHIDYNIYKYQLSRKDSQHIGSSDHAFESVMMKLAYMRFIYPIDWKIHAKIPDGWYGKYYKKYRLNKYGRRVVEELSGTESMPLVLDTMYRLKYRDKKKTYNQMMKSAKQTPIEIDCKELGPKGGRRAYKMDIGKTWKSAVYSQEYLPTGYASDSGKKYYMNRDYYYKPAAIKGGKA